MRVFRQAAIRIWVLTLVTTAWADFDVRVVDARGRQRDIESVVVNISSASAVFIGENHDRYDQHLSELEIIRRLYERDPNRWAIGVEFIQRPFQKVLDAYIAGEISEREFLRNSEYFDRWGFDFRLYRPIFRFAREHAIPMVALNADRELTEKVGKTGLEGLSRSERERLPAEIDKSDDPYRKRLEKIFKQHGQVRTGNFEHFLEAQLVWDETMAESVAGYLSSHPQKSMIVLAGSGHIEFGSGIPNRVRRRLSDVKTAVLITEDKPSKESRRTDYSLISKKEDLPPAPKMGIAMEVSDGVRVKSVTPGSPATDAGIKPKDRIVAIDDHDVKSQGDVRLALLDKKPGDPILMRVQRDGASGTERLMFEMKLQ
jgi:uncharacterized iron-regulated protein